MTAIRFLEMILAIKDEERRQKVFDNLIFV